MFTYLLISSIDEKLYILILSFFKSFIFAEITTFIMNGYGIDF